MSTAVNPVDKTAPHLPTVAEITKWMRERMPGIKIFSPHDDFLYLEVHGRTDLYATPDLGGEIRPHPITGIDTICDGITEIRGRFFEQLDSSGKKIEGQDANAIIHYLCAKHPYGEMGLTWVPGDHDMDESIKAAARRVYREFQYEVDEKVLSRRAEFKANWERNVHTKGKPLPPPTEQELAASDRLQERRASRKKYLFECDVNDCPGYAANEWAKFARHMEATHGYKPDELSRLKKRLTSAETGLSGKEVPAVDRVDKIAEKVEEERPKSRKKARS